MQKKTSKTCKTTADIVQRLVASKNVCDQRKGADLQELVALSRGPWGSRVEVLEFGSLPEGGLAVVCRLSVPGLIWSEGQPIRHGDFVCVLGIPNSYPLAPPTVQFLGAIPWCGHVVHKDSMPDVSQLPAFLQEYRRQGHGRCCYIRSSEWRADIGNLAIVLWQVSRLVSLAKDWGEIASLNPSARDYRQRLAEQTGRLPLGHPLPYPWEESVGQIGAAALAASPQTSPDEDVEWTAKEEEVQPNVS